MTGRWWCHQCNREWVWAHNWDKAQGCPGCHGSAIEFVTYRPQFPGADIPRQEIETVSHLFGVPVPIAAVALVLATEPPPALDLWQMI